MLKLKQRCVNVHLSCFTLPFLYMCCKRVYIPVHVHLYSRTSDTPNNGHLSITDISAGTD